MARGLSTALGLHQVKANKSHKAATQNPVLCRSKFNLGCESSSTERVIQQPFSFQKIILYSCHAFHKGARVERRLTTVLAAEIVGFSRLIENDEEGVLTVRRQHREEIIEPLLKLHGGSRSLCHRSPELRRCSEQ